MKAYNRIMEYFWLFAALVSAALVAYWSVTRGWDEYKYLFIFPAMATLLYFMRRFYRKTQERTEKGEWISYFW